MKKKLVLFLAVSWLVTQQAFADRPQWAIRNFPFALSLNVDEVYKITQTPPEKLIELIQNSGVDVLLVKSSDKMLLPINPLLKGLKPASAQLIKDSEFNDFEAMPLYKNKTPGLTKDVILVSDKARNYTIIHEFLHSKFKVNGGEASLKIASDFLAAKRKFNFYQKKLITDHTRLLNPGWRSDILRAQGDSIELLYAGIQHTQAQEAVIEKLLSQYIDEKNPYYDKARAEEGLKYGEGAVNYAIDLFNDIHMSLDWNKNTVEGLRKALVDGDIEAEQLPHLTEQDLEDFKSDTKMLQDELEPIKAEILRLKKFYSGGK